MHVRPAGPEQSGGRPHNRRRRASRPGRDETSSWRSKIESLTGQNGQAQAREQGIPRGHAEVADSRQSEQLEIALRPPPGHRGERKTDRHQDPPQDSGPTGRAAHDADEREDRAGSFPRRARPRSPRFAGRTSTDLRGRVAARESAAAAPAQTSARGETNSKSARRPIVWSAAPNRRTASSARAGPPPGPLPRPSRRSRPEHEPRASQRKPARHSPVKITSPPVHI